MGSLIADKDNMRKFEHEVLFMGVNDSGYAGAFTKEVQAVINSVIYGKVLHLYSGVSLIGEERIDLESPQATANMMVEDFIESDDREWDWALLDPPYAIKSLNKIKDYAETSSLTGNIEWRVKIKDYFKLHCSNVLWLDYCAPIIQGFKRQKLWFFLPGGYHHIRVLSWLKREMKPLF